MFPHSGDHGGYREVCYDAEDDASDIEVNVLQGMSLFRVHCTQPKHRDGGKGEASSQIVVHEISRAPE